MVNKQAGSADRIRPRTAWIVFAVSLLVVLLAVEGISRLLVPNLYYVWPPSFSMTFDASQNIQSGVTFPSQLTINAAGMRGDLPTDEQGYRILAVGGSTTICVYLDDSQAWPLLLQRDLNAALDRNEVWVGNVGRPGHRSDHHILQMEKLLDQYPDIDMVVSLVGINDLITNLPVDDKRPVRAPVQSQRQMLVMSFSLFPGWDEDTPWYRRNLFGRIHRLSTWRPFPGTQKLRPMDEKGEFVATLRRFRQRAGRFRHDPPELAVQRSAYETNLHRMVDIAQSRDVRLLLVTQPTLWSDALSPAERKLLWAGGPPFFLLRNGATYFSAEALASAMTSYNDTLLKVCGERTIECLDAASRMTPTTDNFYDDAHFTERGSAALASLISDYLLARPPLKP
jgi:lysophospholipase L1-like esterase